MRSTSSFLVVANRLPVDRVGDREWRRSPGGLVTAIAPVMQRRDGAWLGWTGAAGEELKPFDHDGMHLIPVPLSAREVELYYEGFSNATLWPLYHDVVAPPVYSRVFWDAYRAVNKRFADAVVSLCRLGVAEVPLRGVAPEDHVEAWIIDKDDANNDLRSTISDAAAAVRQLRAEGKTVLLHCVHAHTRTPVVAAAYGALVAGGSEREALRRVQQVLPSGRSPRPSIAAVLR